MIVRTWRGRAAVTEPEAYPRHFRESVVPALRRLTGFRGASLLRAEGAGGCEFLVLTRWESMAAIRAFAGAEVARAVVEPGAAAALVDFDATVRHYDLIEDV